MGRDELSFVSVFMKLEDGIAVSSQYVPLIDWLIGVCCSDPSRGQGLGREICLLLENVYQRNSFICILCLGILFCNLYFLRVLLFVVYLSVICILPMPDKTSEL